MINWDNKREDQITALGGLGTALDFELAFAEYVRENGITPLCGTSFGSFQLTASRLRFIEDLTGCKGYEAMLRFAECASKELIDPEKLVHYLNCNAT